MKQKDRQIDLKKRIEFAVASFEDGGRGPQVKKFWRPLEAENDPWQINQEELQCCKHMEPKSMM